MEKRGFLEKRKAMLTYPEIIFLVLNLAFFSVLIVFVGGSVNGRPVYEQAYAKEIAFIIDEAKPDMEIFLNMGESLEEFEKDKPLDAVSLDKDKNKVIVNFGSSGGKSFQYFTNSNLELDQKISSTNKYNKYLVIRVK